MISCSSFDHLFFSIVTYISGGSYLHLFSGGKLLLEMNRILRPGGYFILSSKHDSIEAEEG